MVNPHKSLEDTFGLSNEIGVPKDSRILPRVAIAVDEHSKEMNEIYIKALDAHEQLMELGMNLEPKNGSALFYSAAKMLSIALDASKSKSDQRLKTMVIELDQARLKNTNNANAIDAVVTEINSADSIISDRTSLINKLKAMGPPVSRDDSR